MTENLSYTIIDIPLSDITFPDGEMRTQVSFEGLDDLARSIRTVGLLNPISVRRKNSHYELIAGFRRTKACEMNGMLTVPARVFASTDGISDLQKAHENIFREDVNPLDEGNYYSILLQKHGWKLQDLAAAVHKSISYLSRRMSLGDCPTDVKDALRAGQINLSIAEELAKISDAGTRSRILYLVTANGATVDVVRAWRVQHENASHIAPPVWAFSSPTNADGTENDPAKMGSLSDDQGPQRELSESCREYRICHSCLKKTDVTDAKLLVLCTDCSNAIQTFLPGGAK